MSTDEKNAEARKIKEAEELAKREEEKAKKQALYDKKIAEAEAKKEAEAEALRLLEEAEEESEEEESDNPQVVLSYPKDIMPKKVLGAFWYKISQSLNLANPIADSNLAIAEYFHTKNQNEKFIAWKESLANQNILVTAIPCSKKINAESFCSVTFSQGFSLANLMSEAYNLYLLKNEIAGEIVESDNDFIVESVDDIIAEKTEAE